jgi:hypothetical protein
VLERLDAALADADAALAGSWPGDPGTRQPVHTLYVPADRTGPDIVAATGTSALAVLDAHAPDAAALGRAVGLPEDAVAAVLPRVRAKLEREPVEDLRVDLEDGYGVRPDAEEDEHASAAGALLAAIAAGPGAPFSFGVRIKSFEAPTRRRGVRSFDLVVGALVAAGAVPDGFVVTLPKVTSVEQVSAMVTVCAEIEAAYDLPAGSLRFEVQVETPQVILGADGAATVARIVHAAQGRCSGLHYGTYDYSAALGIAAAYQSLEHPAADHAKAVMQLAAAQTAVRVCDGSTNVLPVGSRAEVHAAWELHSRLVRRSLERGFYQGWDLHPGQLPTRYLATYVFYRGGLDAAAARLRVYVSRLEGGILDEPATARALAGFLLRGVECGALDLDEVLAATGVDAAELHRRAGRVPPGVAAFNRLGVDAARSALLAVCASPRWAEAVAAGRPYRDAESLFRSAESVLAELDERDVDEHSRAPRIGERAGGRTADLDREQAAVALAAGGHVERSPRATGRTRRSRATSTWSSRAAERRGAARRAAVPARQDPRTERASSARSRRRSTRRRLERLLDDPPAQLDGASTTGGSADGGDHHACARRGVRPRPRRGCP